jgi:hypothetical protein
VEVVVMVMGNNYGYGNQKLIAAMSAVATGPGRIQERLGRAAQELCALEAELFPANVRSIFQIIYETCTRSKSGENGRAAQEKGKIAAACDDLTDDEASHMANLIFRMYDGVR